MRTLAIDSATEACSVALFEGEACLGSEWRMLGRGHAEHLVPMIARLPERGRAERIAVNCGPGSFTGIRIGLAAAKALALAWSSALVGYTTHALVAAIGRAEAGEDAAVDVAMIGGHGEWFFQTFGEDGVAQGPVQALIPAAAREVARAPLAAGSCADALAEGRAGVTARTIWPAARSFPLLASRDLESAPRPIYCRPPDAKPAALQNLA